MSSGPMTRRRLLETGAAAGAGALLAGVPGASAARPGHRHPDRSRHRADVVVVGAGLAGLTAARSSPARAAHPQAAHPEQYFETSWSADEWGRGCPVGIPGPGLLHAYGNAIRKPIHRIHWAGTETSTYWNGYMDGAVRSGERAAAEVLAEL